MKLQADTKSAIQSGWQHGLLALALVVAVSLVWYGAEGVRGTDQYWYVADVERIVSGTPPVTNTYFPGEILRNNEVPEPNYIHHNSPMLYLVASIASMFPVYDAWIIANLICHLLVAFVIYTLSRKFTGAEIAAIVSAFYLISPIAIWQTLNPLLEMYYSALVALVLFCYFNRQLKWAEIALLGLLLLGVLSHPIFLAPAVLYSVVWGWEQKSKPLRVVVPICIVYFLAIYYSAGQKEVWFPSSFQPSIKAIIASAVPGESNMFWHYSETLPIVDRELMSRKFVSAVKSHTVEMRFIPFYVFTNIGIMAGIYLSLFRFRHLSFALIPLGVFGVQYLAMIMLQQNHPRFQQIVVVTTFLLIAFAIKISAVSTAFPLRLKYIGMVYAVVICLIGFNGYISHISKLQSIQEARDIGHLTAQIKNFKKHDGTRLSVVDVMPHNPLSYVLRPSDVLFVRTGMLTPQKIEKSLSIFKPDLIIAPRENKVISAEKYRVIGELKSEMFGDLVVYSEESK